jgi:pimeloyl-ACP methyl ester carboxylesterase
MDLALYTEVSDIGSCCRLGEHMDRFKLKLEIMFEASGGKKVDVVTHSMGGLLMKCFLALHPEVKFSRSFKHDAFPCSLLFLFANPASSHFTSIADFLIT